MTSNSIDQKSLKHISKPRYIIPSAVSVIRVFIALLIVVKIGDWREGIPIAALIGVPIVIILDAVDGILARHLNSQTLLGSFIDIAADRLVEFIFLQYFVRAGLVPLWFVLVFYGRIVLTDACRMRAFKREKVSANGIFLPQPWHFLVLSKLSRSSYAALKGMFFSMLLLTMYIGDMSFSLLRLNIMIAVLTFSMLRAIPILITYLPPEANLIGIKLENNRCQEEHNIIIRTTKVASWMQLASDVFIAAILVLLFALH